MQPVEFQGYISKFGKSSDNLRTACKKCGYGGHLTYQCRNFLKADPSKEVVLDVSSTSSDTEDEPFISPLTQLNGAKVSKLAEISKSDTERHKKKCSKSGSSKSRKRSKSKREKKKKKSKDHSSSTDSESSSGEDSKSSRRRKKKKHKHSSDQADSDQDSNNDSDAKPKYKKKRKHKSRHSESKERRKSERKKEVMFLKAQALQTLIQSDEEIHVPSKNRKRSHSH
uniref:Protein SREK1IP1 n=1 Tax=Biomphalaria glabrata TaxID=6526 RepID=A0A2C9JI18_BIOGL